MLKNQLLQLDLSEKEAETYLTLLSIGTNPVSIIANRAELTRTTVYSILENLHKKGLVTYFEKNKVRYYSAERPEIILSMLDRQIRESNLKKKRFQELMPELRNLINKDAGTPQVRYFEGIAGIEEIYLDTLSATEKLAYSIVPNINAELRKFLDDYVQQRVSKNIPVRAIFPDTAKAKHKNDTALLRQSRYVPADKFPFSCEINIYNNKIAYISLQGPHYHGVILESAPIAATERAIFELAWLGAGV